MEEVYSLYQTTNLVNGKVYVGVHKESQYPEVDDYLGSGIGIMRAIDKYGRENFKREFLVVFGCPEDAYAAEAVYVTEEFITEDNYNMCVGGHGGDIRTGMKSSEETRAKLRQLHSDGVLSWKGRTHRPESREKMSKTRTGHKDSMETRKKKSEYWKGRPSNNRRSVIIDGVTFPSVTGAAKRFGCKRDTIMSRIKSPNFPGYTYT
jgi:group I intron endonuclease